MAKTYREIAIEDMVLTVEEAMSRVLDWWGDLPPSMKEAIEQFRAELGRRLIPSILSKRRSTHRRPKLTAGMALPELIPSSAARADPCEPAEEMADTAVGKGFSRRQT
jgi:hypothetical protein